MIVVDDPRAWARIGEADANLIPLAVTGTEVLFSDSDRFGVTFHIRGGRETSLEYSLQVCVVPIGPESAYNAARGVDQPRYRDADSDKL